MSSTPVRATLSNGCVGLAPAALNEGQQARDCGHDQGDQPESLQLAARAVRAAGQLPGAALALTQGAEDGAAGG